MRLMLNYDKRNTLISISFFVYKYILDFKLLLIILYMLIDDLLIG